VFMNILDIQNLEKVELLDSKEIFNDFVTRMLASSDHTLFRDHGSGNRRKTSLTDKSLRGFTGLSELYRNVNHIAVNALKRNLKHCMINSYSAVIIDKYFCFLRFLRLRFGFYSKLFHRY